LAFERHLASMGLHGTGVLLHVYSLENLPILGPFS
jgi:hypothetical protein